MEQDKKEMIIFYDTELRSHEDAVEVLKKSYDASLARVKQAGEIYIRDFSENYKLKMEIETLKAKAKGFDTEERLVRKGSHFANQIRSQLLTAFPSCSSTIFNV
jgi:hypothetical protein